jgi:hypothetical protein
MLEIELTVLSAVLQAVLAFWGFKLSTGPLESPRQHRFYKWGFISVGLVGIGITVAQGYMNLRASNALNASIERLEKGVTSVEQQTKEPPAITVNVPPIQVVAPQEIPRPKGPLPTYRLTEYTFPIAMNDAMWRTIGDYQVRLNWNDLQGIDAYAEVQVWAKECGTGGAARTRIFNVTTDRGVAEGDWVNPPEPPDVDKLAAYQRFWHCKPVMQRLKLPREKGAHAYVLQAWSQGSGYATAIGEIVLEWQR